MSFLPIGTAAFSARPAGHFSVATLGGEHICRLAHPQPPIAAAPATPVSKIQAALNVACPALAALPLAEGQRKELYRRLRGLLKKGSSRIVIEELKTLAAGQADDSPVWREIRYLIRHSDAGRLRYHYFRCRGVPLGSGAIESTIRRVINLRLKGNGIYWTEDNAEAVLQLRAAVVSGRWEEIMNHTREAMARDRRTDWRWTPLACLTELKALDEKDEGFTQNSTRKRSMRVAA